MVMESLGPEPLEAEFTPRGAARARAASGRAPIKSVILDQTVLAGMGNLYTDEALHYAKIHPLRPANKLKPDDWRRLHAGILEALRMGIDGARQQPRHDAARPHQRRWRAGAEPGDRARVRPRGRAVPTTAARPCAASRSAAAAASSARSASPRPRGAVEARGAAARRPCVTHTASATALHDAERAQDDRATADRLLPS